MGATVGTAVADLGIDLAAVNGPLLAPGVGAQGGTAEDLRQVFGDARRLVLAASSREVLAAGPSVTACATPPAARRTAHRSARRVTWGAVAYDGRRAPAPRPGPCADPGPSHRTGGPLMPSRMIARGLAALTVTAVEVGHDELEARRRSGPSCRTSPSTPSCVLHEAVAAVAELAPAEMREASGERQLLAALEARSWLERMTVDSARGVPL